MKLRVTKAKNPVKKIMYKDTVELVIQGVDMVVRSWVYQPMELIKKYDGDEEAKKILAEEVVNRTIRACLKEVNNLEIEDKDTLELKDFKLEFDDNDLITEECYTEFKTILHDIPEIMEEIMKAYYDMSKVDVKIVEDKKKV